MSSGPGNSVRTCPRCGRTIEPRGNDLPRFCAVCGLRLVPLHRDVQQALATSGSSPASAKVALVLGLCSLLPMIGLPLGVAAIVVGGAARARIREANGRLGGVGLATAGMTLGIVTSIIWLLVCLGRH